MGQNKPIFILHHHKNGLPTLIITQYFILENSSIYIIKSAILFYLRALGLALGVFLVPVTRALMLVSKSARWHTIFALLATYATIV